MWTIGIIVVIADAILALLGMGAHAVGGPQALLLSNVIRLRMFESARAAARILPGLAEGCPRIADHSEKPRAICGGIGSLRARDTAFTLLRDYARNSNQRLTDVARNFVTSATADFPPPPRRISAQP